MNVQKLYLVSIIVIILILLLVFWVVYSHKRKKALREKLEELERGRNLIVATPVMTELDKIKVIVHNDELEGKYSSWQKRYDVIKNERYSEITDKLLNVDTLIEDILN